MSHWYYAGADRQRHGPVDRQTLLAAIADQSLPDSTQLWQEGWPQWRPLSECRELLGLAAAAAAPPPLPPALPPPIATSRPVSPAPPGMSRRAVVLIVLGVAGLVAVFVIAMLAAIALPAYQDYTARAKVSMAVGQTLALRDQVEGVVEAQGGCPDNGTEGFSPAQTYASQHVESVVIGEFDDDTCGLEVVLKDTGKPALDGRRLWWARGSDGQWVCSSEIEDRYLPPQCRG